MPIRPANGLIRVTTVRMPLEGDRLPQLVGSPSGRERGRRIGVETRAQAAPRRTRLGDQALALDRDEDRVLCSSCKHLRPGKRHS